MPEYLTKEEADGFFQDVKDLFRDTDQKFKDTDRKFKDTDRKFKETRELLDNISRKIGELGNRLGEFVQEMVRPAVVRLFRERGLDVHMVLPNVYVLRDNESMEIDLLVTNDDVALAVECKSRLDVDDVNDHLDRLNKLKRLLPKYRDTRLMGAVAGMVVSDDVARYAYRKGLYVLAQRGNMVIIRNDDEFIPRVW